MKARHPLFTLEAALFLALAAGVVSRTAAASADPVTDDGFTMLNIVPMAIGREAASAADVKEYVEQTGNRIVLYSLTLHPQGRPALAKVDRAVASYRAFAAALAGTSARPGILLQAVLGHWVDDAVNRDVEPWQRTIDSKGRVRRWCAFDPGFRDYVRTVGARLAAARPCLILSDDDVRTFSPEAECFCPLHCAEYNRLTDRQIKPADFPAFIAGVARDSKEHAAFVELQKRTVVDVCRLLREGIDSVDPTIPAGVCQPGWPWSKALVGANADAIASKTQRPFLRLANGRYQERGPKEDPLSDFIHSQWLIHSYEGRALPLSEADTYPQNTWMHSASYFHEKLAVDAFNGMKGAKMWYVNARKNGEPVNRHYTRVLARHRGYYPAISAAVRGTTWQGVAIPLHRGFPFTHAVKIGDDSPADAHSWGAELFGKLGVPFQCTEDITRDDCVYALATAQAVARFTDAELKTLLARRLLVDGAAAMALIQRGFAAELGVNDSGRKGGYTAERREDTGAILTNPLSTGMPIFEKDPAAETLTSLIWQPYSGAEEIQRVAPSATLFRNKLGGTVLVTAYRTVMPYASALGEARQKWLYSLLDRLTDNRLGNVAAMPQNTFAAARRAADGTELLFIVNTNYDADEQLLVRRAQKPSKVEVMDDHGAWTEPVWRFADGHVTIEHALPCYDTALLRFRD